VAPSQLPDDLHWFKWEAYFTWMSGFALLVLAYYVGAKSFLIDPSRAALGQMDAIGIGLSALVLGWVVYDGLCRSPLGKDNRALGVVWFAFLVGMAWALCQVFNPRGAYLHIGAMIGTVMAANVFAIIIPNQRKVVAALKAGQPVDPALGKAGKQRSVHNNYMTVPILFIMISHHYPMTFGAQRPWLVLALLGATGVAVRHVFNLRHRDAPTGKAMALAGALALVTVTYVSAEKRADAAPATAVAAAPPSFAQVQPILQRHCSGCHAVHPTHDGITDPPLGIVLDTAEHVAAVAPRIKAVAVDAEIMPLGNETGMTRAERDQLGRWIAAGAQP
jgi:uncharacterized membrane protein